MNPATALAETVIDELVRCGVRHLCLAPGSRSAPLGLAAARSALAVHVGIDERSVAFLALGIAKGSGVPTAVVCTSGTAAANLYPAIVEADRSATPLLALTADRPPELRGAAANQTIDQIKMFGDTVRSFVEVGAPGGEDDPERYGRSLASRAVADTTGSPPGPVHLNLAFREPLVGGGEEAQGRPRSRPWTEVVRASSVLGDDVVDALARRLSGRRAVVVAGDGRCDPVPIVNLAEAAGWPVLAEPLSGMRRGRNAISTYDALLRTETFTDEHRPDVALRIGVTGASKVLPRWLDGVEQILIDEHGRLLDPERVLNAIVAGDPTSVAAALLEHIEPTDASWIESWRAAEARARAALDSVLDRDDEPNELRTARDLARLVPEGSALVVASSMPVRDLDRTMSPRAGIRIFGNRGASGIDGFVSTSMGVALAYEGRTFALAGDLSMLHDSNGLTLTSGDRPDVTFVVVNNDGGGIFSFLPQAEHESFELLFGTPHGLSFEDLARLHRCTYRRVERARDLAGAIEDEGVAIVEVRTDRAANVELHRALTDAVVRAVA